MNTTNKIATEFEAIVPAELREKYSHLTYAEMADQPDCAQYADELRRLDTEWNEAEAQ